MLEKMSLEYLLAVDFEDVEHYPYSHIKLVAVDQQRTIYVFLDDVALGTHVVVVHFYADLEGIFAEKFGELLQVGEQVNASASVERCGLEDPKSCLLLTGFWFFLQVLSSHALIKCLSLFQQSVDLFVSNDYLHEIVLDSDGSALRLLCLLLEVKLHELKQAFLYLTLFLFEIYDEGCRNIVANRLWAMSLHVLVQSFLVGQLALSLQVIIDHICCFCFCLADLRQMVLIQAFRTMKARYFLAAGLKPAYM